LLILLRHKAIKGCSARRNQAKKRSLHGVNEHFEPDFNAAMCPSALCDTVELVMAVLLATMLTSCATAPHPSAATGTPKTVNPVNIHPAEPTEKKSLPKNTLPLIKNSSAENLVTKNPTALRPTDHPTHEKKTPVKMAWQVSVIQDATLLESNGEKISLKKTPFNIRVTLPAPHAVRFAAASVQPDLEASHSGKHLKSLCTPATLTPFCHDRAISIAYVDHNHNLSLQKFTHHYFFRRKNVNLSWMKVRVTPLQTTFEWTVKTINNKPLASYQGSEIYLTLWVDSENRLVFEKGELKQVILSFPK
jgi:hypothetical protein